MGGIGQWRRSTFAFAACALVLIAIKLLFDFYTDAFPGDQASAFTWVVVGSIVAIGLAGLFAERSLRFPDAFADMALERRGWLIAVATGLAYGLFVAARDYWFQGGREVIDPADWAHMPWPWSLPFYTFGAILLEFMLRLGALCILVWLIHVVLLRRRWLMPVFWTVNLIVAFYEIMPLTMEDIARRDWLSVALTPVEPLYWTNAFEGWLLLRFGWFAPIVFRLAFYLVWHIAYGGLGPFSAA